MNLGLAGEERSNERAERAEKCGLPYFLGPLNDKTPANHQLDWNSAVESEAPRPAQSKVTLTIRQKVTTARASN